MADKWPLAAGVWSNAANWNGGSKPVSGDDVYADGFTVTIDEVVNIGTGTLRTSQRSGGTTGGGFTLGGNFNVTANLAAGTTSCLTASSRTATVTGNITGGTAASASYGINISAGTITIVGNVTGGSGGSGHGANIVGGSTVDITGNIVGGTGGIGLSINQTTPVTVTGTVTGGTNVVGISVVSSSAVTINGNVYGGTNANVNFSYSGIRVTGTGLVTINGAAIASADQPAIVVTNASAYAIVATAESASNGMQPTLGRIVFSNLSTATRTIYNSAGTAKTLYPTDYSGLLPATTDVKTGVIYNLGNSTGTYAASGGAVIMANAVAQTGIRSF